MFFSDNLEQCIEDPDITRVSCTLFISIITVTGVEYLMAVSLIYAPNPRQVIAKQLKVLIWQFQTGQDSWEDL